VQSIESGLVSKVRSLGARYSRTTAAESLEVLANPDHEITRDWAIVYDNVDDSKINIARYLPQCTFGTIVITTRNPNLGNLAPTAHLKLDVMSEEEAIDVLLRSAVPPPRTPTETDRQHARAIAHELGYLPVALVQAGYFIKIHDCMEEYRQRLRELRPDILNRPAREQLDDHYHGVYATLDVTWPHLSPRAQSFLSILAFVKYTGFPLVLLYGAAILGFQFQPWNFVERSAPFRDTVQLLCDTFRPRDEWSEQDVDDLVAELERYSLVTRMTTFTVTMLRLHPLVHSWTHDRLSTHERERYQAAAIRLLVCGSGDDDEDIHEFLFPHVGLFHRQISRLHVNDRAGIANIYAHQRDYKTSMVLWEGIWNDISVLHENNELVTSEVKLRLAALLWEPIHEHDLRLISRGSFHLNSMEEFSLEYRNQTRKALKMEHDAVESRIRALGVAHPMTVKATLQLARGIARSGKRDQAIAKLRDIIRFWEEQTDETWEDVVRAKEALAEICPKLESIGLWEEIIQERAQRRTQEHHATLKAMEALARNYREIAMYQSGHPSERLKHYVSATDLWVALVATRTKRRGIRHPDTLDAMESLARSYWLQHDEKLSVEMWKQVKGLREDTQGDSHKETLNAMEELAKRYIRCKPPRFKEAEVLRKELIRLREQSQGPCHDKTLGALRELADMYAESRDYDEAESQWVEVIKRTREEYGHSDERTILAVTELARMYKRGKRYQQAEARWEEVIRLRMESQETCHKLTLEAVQELANSYCQDHRYEKAETRLREVINLRSKLYGLDHESTVDAIGHLAQVYAEREQYNEAELEWRKVIVLRGESGVQTYNRARGAEESLAQIYFRLGRYPEAEEMWRRVTNWSNIQGDDYQNALNGLERLAHMYTNRSWHTKAEALWNDVIYLRKEAHGLRHGRTLDAMTSLARVHASCRRHTAAEALWREVILARKDMQGPHHKCTFAEMSELARMYAGCERYDEAEAQWKEIITVMDEMLVMRREAQAGRTDFFFDAMQAFAEMMHWNNETLRFAEDPWFLPEDPQQIREKNTLEAMRQKIWARKELAEMYAQCKRYDDAEAEWREVITLGSEMHSPAQTFFGMERLADMYMQRKRYQEAESLCKEVINEGTEFLGLDSPVILNSMETLPRVYKECMRYTEAEALLKRMIALSVEVDSSDDRDILSIQVRNAHF
jgi:tetratricopeptide (TPR) repeat protein